MMLRKFNSITRHINYLDRPKIKPVKSDFWALRYLHFRYGLIGFLQTRICIPYRFSPTGIQLCCAEHVVMYSWLCISSVWSGLLWCNCCFKRDLADRVLAALHTLSLGGGKHFVVNCNDLNFCPFIMLVRVLLVYCFLCILALMQIRVYSVEASSLMYIRIGVTVTVEKRQCYGCVFVVCSERWHWPVLSQISLLVLTWVFALYGPSRAC